MIEAEVAFFCDNEYVSKEGMKRLESQIAKKLNLDSQRLKTDADARAVSQPKTLRRNINSKLRIADN